MHKKAQDTLTTFTESTALENSGSRCPIAYTWSTDGQIQREIAADIADRPLCGHTMNWETDLQNPDKDLSNTPNHSDYIQRV